MNEKIIAGLANGFSMVGVVVKASIKKQGGFILPVKKGFSVLLLLLVACIYFPSDVSATTISFSNFNSTTGLQLNGGAIPAFTGDGNIVRLAYQNVQAGSLFTTNTVNVSRFSTSFSFRISDTGGNATDPSGQTGADGLTFTIQFNSPSIVGNNGGGMGYGGIPQSLAVEFDTWFNDEPNTADPNSNHIGIDVNGSAKSLVTTDLIEPRFDDGNIWYAWIDYDGNTLEIRANQSGSEPSLPLLQYNINIQDLINGNMAYVGFTSGTGGSWGNHDIISWELKETSPVPEPTTMLLLGTGIVGLAGSRLRRKN